MQKTGKNASILIWSIFLSIIISLWFISISTHINKTLKNNSDIQEYISSSNQVKNILNSQDYTSQQLDNGTFLSLPDKNNYIWSLQENQVKEFWFSWTTLDFIQISINNWGPLKYKYDIWSNSQEYNILTTWSISFSWNLNNSDTSSTLSIENLWWYTFFEINSDQNIIVPERYYKIWKKIWNKNVLLQNQEIK